MKILISSQYQDVIDIEEWSLIKNLTKTLLSLYTFISENNRQIDKCISWFVIIRVEIL